MKRYSMTKGEAAYPNNRELNEMNDGLKLALKYAEAVINTAHQPFLVLDKDMRILRANPAFYKAFKTTPETTEGQLLYDLGDRQWDIPELRQFLQALLLQDTSFKDCEITHAFPDVGRKTMRLNGTNLVGGDQFQILLAIEDVTDYRTALNTLKELNDKSKLALNYARSLIEASLDPLVTISAEGKITDVNAATIKVTGVSRENLIGTDFSSYFTEPEKAQEGYRQVFAKGMVTDYPLTIRHAGGELTDVLYNASVYRDEQGIVLGVFAAARDVTAQKQGTRELNELNDKMKLALNYAEAVLNTAHQPFLVLDKQLQILRANPAFYKAFKTTPETTEGRLLYDLGDKQWDIPELRQFLQALLLLDASFQDCEITHVFPNVGKKTMRLNGTNLAGGEQFQVLLAIEDVSDYRTALNTQKELNDKLELALTYSEAVLNTAHQPFLVLDKDLRILQANPAFYKIFKTAREATEGRILYDLGDRQWDIPELRQFLQTLLLEDTSFKNCEITHIFPNVGKKTMRLNGTNLDGRVEPQILLAIEDVSDYRMALDILKDSNEDLEEFAHIASHDLREPLRGMQNHAHLLLKDYGDKLDEKAVYRLKRLVYLSQRTTNLIRDLLYFSLLGRSDIDLEKTDTNGVINEVRDMLESLLQEKNAKIMVPKPLPHIACDKTKVTEVFSNLITNAVKYNDKPEPVVEIGFLDVMETAQGRERDVFYVKDNGIGIEPEFHQEIFRLFRRLHPGSDKNARGTGAGLTFVKKIIERHHGRVWVESEPGKGATFYFTLDQGKIKP